MRRSAAISVLVVLVILASCSDGATPPTDPQASSRLVPINPALIGGLTWPSDGTLYIEIDPESASSSPSEIWTLGIEGGELEPTPLPEQRDCRQTRYHSPFLLNDGRVGVVLACDLESGAESPATYSLLEFSPSDFDLQPLIARAPLGYFSFAAPVATVNAAGDEAALFVGDELCGTIALIGRDGVQPIDLTIGTPPNSWTLGQFLESDSADCDDQGRASWPAWSPSTEGPIAFFGSPESVGISGQSRLDVPWNLYLWQPGTDDLQQVLQGIGSPRALSWSPDGQWLAFVGEINGQPGLWLLNPDTMTRVYATSDPVISLAWSPDGQRIAATLADTGEPLYRTVAVYRVGNLLE